MTGLIEAAAKAELLDSANEWLASPPTRGAWFQKNCPLLYYARVCECQFDCDVMRAFAKLKKADHDLISEQVLPSSGPEIQKRCAATMRGMLAAIEAGIRIASANWQPNRGVTIPAKGNAALSAAVEHYVRAWGLTPGGSALPYAELGSFENPPRALMAMVESVQADTGSAPAWLAVHRLLAFILGEPVPAKAPKARPGEPGNPVKAKMLLCSQDQLWGYVQDVSAVRQAKGPLASWTVDPVALGLTVLHAELIESFQLACCTCSSALVNKPAAIRLEPDITGFTSLDGPSAGALMTCAMFAAANGVELNTDASASVAIVPPPGWTPASYGAVNLDEIKLSGVGGLEVKFRAARAAGIRTVALSRDDCAEAMKNEWHACPQGGPALQLIASENLRDVYRALTGNARIERALADHAKHCVWDWDPVLLGESPPAASHRRLDKPEPYVEPHLAQLVPAAARKEHDGTGTLGGRDRQLRPLLDERTRNGVTPQNERETAEREFSLFLKLGERICVVEDANGGKTVFTKRLRSFLGSESFLKSETGRELFDGKPVLAARFENVRGGFSARWPLDGQALLEKLKDEIEPFCAAHDVAPAEVVEYALKRHRIVLILDALDQAGNADRLLEFINHTNRQLQKCRVIITGRTYKFAIDETGSAFPPDRYQFVTLLGFSENQQSRGLARFLGDRKTESLFANYEEAKEQLAVPGMLKLSYDVASKEEKPHAQGELVLRGLRTRADFYWRYYQGPMLAAARKPSGDGLLPMGDEPKWQMMMAVTAFRMILQRATDFYVSGDRANRIRDDVERYCAACGEPVTIADWRNLETFSVLTDHGALEGRDDNVLSWRHKGWMEFFAGLFLAKHVRPEAMRAFQWDEIRPVDDDDGATGFHSITETDFAKGEAGGEQLCRAVLTQITNDPDWQWAWRFLAQIPTMPSNHRPDFSPQSMELSLGALFQRPARGLRPTELMYYAWPLLENMNDSPHLMALPRGTQPLESGGKLLAAYQRQFLDVLLGGDLGEACVAAQLAPEPLLEQLAAEGKISRATLDAIKPLRAAFACCPAGSCTQGTPGKEGDDERPHPFEISSFLLQATTVTREQYALFDRASAEPGQFYFDPYQIKKSEYPIVNTSWFDAWCFARWCGGRLPTDAEWEYACRAGSQARFCRVKGLDEANNYQDIDAVAELQSVACFGEDNLEHGPQAVARLAPNLWGLYDMHGNVWEWCADWYEKCHHIKVALCGERTVLPANWSRVLRGGSFFNDADRCRAAVRDGDRPGTRSPLHGFRVARGLPCLSKPPRLEL